jgi:hypothetical protein
MTVDAPEDAVAGKRLVLFYSWQSDLPDPANRNGIRNALRAARTTVRPNFSLVIDEATRDVPGSPNVPSTIADKIRDCDMFVADVTTITGAGAAGRPCPNPNVVFELGYAVAQVGWRRIILLLNEAVSPLSDLPFDFDRHRAMTYRHGERPTKAEKDALAASLSNAVSMIARHDPPRPRDLEGKSPEQIVRERDVESIRWALEQIHQPSLDDFAVEMPDRFHTRMIFHLERFRTVLQNSLFHVSDERIDNLLQDMLEGWSSALSRDEHYRQSNHPAYHVWDGGRDARAMAARAFVQRGLEQLEHARRELLSVVRRTYVEIDIAAANTVAFDAYRRNGE